MTITLRVLDGADRGRIYGDVAPPVTIGREEGNSIQLNDERVSRFHLKIQEDHQKLVLTDLESTNGTKVNGEDIQLRILRYGDMITLGRSVLLFGSRDEIAGRLAAMRRGNASKGTVEPSESLKDHARSLDFDLDWDNDDDPRSPIHSLEPPELPDRLTPGQAAQLAELIEFVHIRIRNLMSSVETEGKGEIVSLELRQWQSLLDLQGRLAKYLRDISGPDD